ncbi:hypothetical protein [Litoreibacter halocynthiae]|nr:hypothetical protein [Litoreibacter halocynthiae]
MFVYAFYENYAIRPYSPVSYLVMAPALRAVTPIAQCSPLVYQRYFQECGGICGEQQRVWFGTTATLETLQNTYDLDALRAQLKGFDEVSLHLAPGRPGLAEGCNEAWVSAYDDYAID